MSKSSQFKSPSLLRVASATRLTEGFSPILGVLAPKGKYMGKDTVSPITKPLLNLPGQSTDNALQELLEDHFLFPMMFLATLFIMCGMEWFGYLTKIPRNPLAYSVITMVAAIVMGIHWKRQWSRAQALQLGRQGERAVAEYLNHHLEIDARVFHDLPTNHGNIDHVIICSKGIYAVETKTRSKPRRRGALVSIASNGILVDGFKPDRDPLAQAQTCAIDLHQIMKSFTKRPIFVQPIVAFPGWDIVDRRETTNVWVVEPRDIGHRLSVAQDQLTEVEVARLARRLGKYIRASKQPTALERTATGTPQ
jgi:hypothetical protein